MTTKLGVFNKALTEHLGERALSSLTENVESRRVLDTIWSDGFVVACLEAGFWKFAKRTTKLTYNAAVTPAFGHQYAFAKPSDFVRTYSLCTDEFLTCPLLQYEEEGGQWFASVQELYVAYISSDLLYGSDLSLWPASFTDFAAASLALRAIGRIGQNRGDKDALQKEAGRLLSNALSKDAIEGPTKMLPPGDWTTSRRGGTSGEGRRNKGSFYG